MGFAENLGQFAGGLSGALEAGFRRNVSENRTQLAREQFTFDKQGVERQRQAEDALTQLIQGQEAIKEATAQAEDRSAGAATLERLGKLAQVPKKHRKGFVDAWAREMQSQGRSVDPTLISMLKSTESEELDSMVGEWAANYGATSMGQEGLDQLMSNPGSVLDAVTQAQEDFNNPAAATNRRAALLQREIQQAEQRVRLASRTGNATRVQIENQRLQRFQEKLDALQAPPEQFTLAPNAMRLVLFG